MFFRIYRPFLDGVFRFFITFAAQKKSTIRNRNEKEIIR